MDPATAAALLATQAPIAPRQRAPDLDLSYTEVVSVRPSDPELRAHFPCPEGDVARGLPIIDCTGDEVCPTRMMACWDATDSFDGPMVAWQGDRKVAEMVYVHGVLDGPAAAWWPDGSPRWLDRYERGQEVGPRHHWDAGGTRTTSAREGRLERAWGVSPSGWLVYQSVRELEGDTATPPELWTLRRWSTDGQPESVEIDARAPTGTVAARWDDGGLSWVASMDHGRPDGEAYVRTSDGFAVEHWSKGRFQRVETPPGATLPPRSGAGLRCPKGAFLHRYDWTAGEVERRCATLSGYPLGPSRTTRADGTLSAESQADALGWVTSTGWCADGTIWTHEERDHPERTVSGSCREGGW